MSKITSTELRKLIRLSPALSVKSGDLRGQLVALNQEQLVIHWEHGQENLFSAGPIAVEVNAQRSVVIHAKQESKFIVPSDPAHSERLTDLLHQIRKEQHIHICATEDVESRHRDHGFATIELPQVALPELAWDDINIHRRFMGKEFGAPILITGMTGGIEKATMINERLAAAAVKLNVPMGVGSQRLAIPQG